MKMKMTNEENNVNDVKGVESPSAGPSSGRCPVGEQHGPGHQSTTAKSNDRKRLQWTVQDNKELMFCYYRSQYPVQRGYRKRLFEIWQERNKNPAITEQNLADRARIIQKKNWITKIQLDEIRKTAENEEPQQSSSDNEIPDQQSPMTTESPEKTVNKPKP